MSWYLPLFGQIPELLVLLVLLVLLELLQNPISTYPPYNPYRFFCRKRQNFLPLLCQAVQTVSTQHIY